MTSTPTSRRDRILAAEQEYDSLVQQIRTMEMIVRDHQKNDRLEAANSASYRLRGMKVRASELYDLLMHERLRKMGR